MNDRTSLHLVPGFRVDHYQLDRLIDEGAVARVYEATDLRDGCQVAVKVLRGHLAADKTALARWQLEYATAASLRSPYVVRMLAHGSVPERSLHYLVMERLDGQTLATHLAAPKPMPRPAVLRLTAQLALALRDAHAAGIVHRDIKPSNILLLPTSNGLALRLLDFGTVKLQIHMGRKLTELGTTLGTPDWMSPEQLQGHVDLDPRSDVFSAAVVVYEMLCGRHPFRGANVQETMLRLVDAVPEVPSRCLPGLPVALDEVFLRALHKDKRFRTASAELFAQQLLAALGLEGLGIEQVAELGDAALEAHLSGASARATPAAFGGRPGGSSRRIPKAWLWSAAALALVLALLAAWRRLG